MSAPSCRRAQCASARSTRRSEEHTSELQSPTNLVCRLLLEKNKVSSLPNHEGAAGRAGQLGHGLGHLFRERTERQLRTEPDANLLSLLHLFFKDGATPEISPFSQHAALPV